MSKFEQPPASPAESGHEQSAEKFGRAKDIFRKVASSAERTLRGQDGGVDHEAAVSNFVGFRKAMERMAEELEEAGKILEGTVPAETYNHFCANTNFGWLCGIKTDTDHFSVTDVRGRRGERAGEWTALCQRFYDEVQNLPGVFQQWEEEFSRAASKETGAE